MALIEEGGPGRKAGASCEGADMANDTHGAVGVGWYGFDLDGTLAKYDGWKGIDHIGEPVASIVELMKKMVGSGLRVKILTARVSPRTKPEDRPNPYLENHWCISNPADMPWATKNRWTAREFIQEWCWRNLGFVPEITHQKDHLMLNLFDDRVTQVEPNTGRILGRLPPELDRFSRRRGRYVMKTCPRCGHERLMYSSAKRCAECRAELAKEANRRSYIRKAMRG